MGKGKSATNQEKILRSRPVEQIINMPKKRKQNNSCDVDSLQDIKKMAESRKLNGLDKKIKFLKTELKSLLSDKKPCKEFYSSSGSENDLENNKFGTEDQSNAKDLECSMKQTFRNCKNSENVLTNNSETFKPSCSSTPSKFSEWLSKTIDEMNLESPSLKESVNSNNVVSDLEVHLLTDEKFSVTTDLNSSISDSCLVSSEKIEQLLYKSFVMKNLNSDIYICSSDDDDDDDDAAAEAVENTKFSKVSEHQKNVSFRKFSRNSNCSKSAKKNKRKPRSYLLREKKGKLINLKPPQSDVETINLDDSPYKCEISKTYSLISPETSTICVDSDVNNCDWNEPFDVNLDSGSHSHLNVKEVENNDLKEINSLNEELESECAELMNSISYDEIGRGQPKRFWECPVCFEQSKGQEIVATQCGHVFCKKCVESHFSNLGKTCPTCRSDLTHKPVITLFNF